MQSNSEIHPRVLGTNYGPSPGKSCHPCQSHPGSEKCHCDSLTIIANPAHTVDCASVAQHGVHDLSSLRGVELGPTLILASYTLVAFLSVDTLVVWSYASFWKGEAQQD